MAVDLSIVVAVYNEHPKNLYVLLDRLAQSIMPTGLNYEVVFVNDGSAQATSETLRKIAAETAYVKLVNLSRNFGQQAAISAGFDHADGQAIVNIDSDCQDPPELIPDMVKLWQEGYDVVYAKRSVRKDKFLKRFSAFLFYRVLSSVSSIDIPWDTGDFRLIDRKVLNALNSLPEKTRFLRGQIPWLGFKQVGISIDRGARVVGESSYTIKRLFKLAFDGLLSFSAMPLFLVPVLGLALFAIATLSMFVCIVAMFFLPEASISLQLFLAVSFVSALIGLQTGLLGILAIYLTKVLDEVRGRPVYIVAERLGQGFGEQASVARNSTLSTSNVFSGAEYGNSLAPPRL